MYPVYITNFIDSDISDLLLNHLLNDFEWQKCPTVYGCFLFDSNYIFNNNYVKFDSQKFSKPIKDILNILNANYNCNFNACLLNKYENKSHHLQWHSDDSKQINKDHNIAIISFGSNRKLQWKLKISNNLEETILESGSLLIMPAGFQKRSYHRVLPGDEDSIRVSLVFINFVKENENE